jgi:predicted  nucleic acid-binding Zn-ribbon protein
LEAEKKALEGQVQELKNGSSTREADERTLRLQANVNELRVKLEEAMNGFSQQRLQLEEEIEELTHRNAQLLGENQRLKSMGGSLGKLEEENRELAVLV